MKKLQSTKTAKPSQLPSPFGNSGNKFTKVKRPIKQIGKSELKPSKLIKVSKHSREGALKILIGIFIVFGILAIYTPMIDYGTYLVQSNTANPEIKDIAHRSGLNLHGKMLFFAAKPELVDADKLNQKCPHDETNIEYGCYISSTNNIYILKVTNNDFKSVEVTTAVHETLHAAWDRLEAPKKAEVAKLLHKLYDDGASLASKQLHDELGTYSSDNDTIQSELHSFVGSEVSSDDMDIVLDDYYATYFDDRYQSVASNKEFKNAINDKITSLTNLSNQLDSDLSAIDKYKSQWLDSYWPIQRQLEYYGDYATYNSNVTKYNKNIVTYNNMVNNYNKKRDDYNNQISIFNAILSEFYPTKSQFNKKD